jgi:hypothetical protein
MADTTAAPTTRRLQTSRVDPTADQPGVVATVTLKEDHGLVILCRAYLMPQRHLSCKGDPPRVTCRGYVSALKRLSIARVLKGEEGGGDGKGCLQERQGERESHAE